MSEDKTKLIAFRVAEDDPALALFEANFGQKGPTGERMRYLKMWFHISCLVLHGSPNIYLAADLTQIWVLACKIAGQRHEGKTLRSLDSLRAKFIDETSEFHDVIKRTKPYDIERLNRIASIVYYLVQLYAHDGNANVLMKQLSLFCQLAQIPMDIAIAVAIAKFKERANEEGDKNVKFEEDAMKNVISFIEY
jgi:hypothetical protein